MCKLHHLMQNRMTNLLETNKVQAVKVVRDIDNILIERCIMKQTVLNYSSIVSCQRVLLRKLSERDEEETLAD